MQFKLDTEYCCCVKYEIKKIKKILKKCCLGEIEEICMCMCFNGKE